MTWITVRRIAGLLGFLLAGALAAFVLLNRGAVTGPDPEGSTTMAEERSPGTSQEPEEPALVEKMLDGLREGRSVRSFDNPAAGANIPVPKTTSNVAVGQVEVPAMALQTPFYEGVHDAVIDRGPGHWPGTPLPGNPGNSVISGHRATHGSEFVDLDLLDPGDPIRVEVSGRDRPVTFRVTGTTIVKESRYVPYVTKQPEDPTARVLTLFACNPVWDSTHRIVVRAEAEPTGLVRG